MRIILVLTLIIILSCSNKKYNETLSNHFNTEQINDFEKINDFFISEALNGSKSNYKKEFQEFLEDKMFNGYDSFLKKIDFNKQKELYTTISKSSFDELWEFCKSRNRNKETFKSICLRQEQNTKFRSYLKELSKSNDFAKLCFTTIDDNGITQNNSNCN